MGESKGPHDQELQEVAEVLKEAAEKVQEVADEIAPELSVEGPLSDRDGPTSDAVTIDRNTEPEPGSGGPH